MELPQVAGTSQLNSTFTNRVKVINVSLHLSKTTFVADV